METDWERSHFTQDKVVFEPYTNAESFFVGGGCLLTVGAGCLAIGALAEQNARYLLGTLGLGMIAAFFYLLYSKLQDIVEIDFQEKLVSRQRRLGSVLLKNDVTRFEAVHGVVAWPSIQRDARNASPTWFYSLGLVGQDGRLIELTHNKLVEWDVAQTAAQRLADRMECQIIEGQAQRKLKIVGSYPPEVGLVEVE